MNDNLTVEEQIIEERAKYGWCRHVFVEHLREKYGVDVVNRALKRVSYHLNKLDSRPWSKLQARMEKAEKLLRK